MTRTYRTMSKYMMLGIILLMSSFIIQCDPDDKETCGKTFHEIEGNNSINGANDFNIMMKNDCKIIINGTVSASDIHDHFRLNTGDANKINIRVFWNTGGDDIDLFIYDFDGWLLDDGLTSDVVGAGNDTGIDKVGIDYQGYRFDTIYIDIKNVWGVNTSYTLIIQGTTK